MVRRRPAEACIVRVRKGQIEAAPQAILAGDLRIDVLKVLNRWQHDLRGERKRRDRSPRRDGPVVRAIRRPACDVVKERALDAAHTLGRPAWAIARGQAPEVLPVALEFKRIPDRVRLLDVGRAAAVFAVVDALVSRKRILDPSEVHKHVRGTDG